MLYYVLDEELDERAQNVVMYATERQSESLFSRVRDPLPVI